MILKRGVLVVLVLVLIVSLSTAVFAVGGELNSVRHIALGVSAEAPTAKFGCDYDSDDGFDCWKDTNVPNSGLYDADNVEYHSEGDGERAVLTVGPVDTNFEKDCPALKKYTQAPPLQKEVKGCNVVVSEHDLAAGDDDDTGFAYIKQGIVLNRNERPIWDSENHYASEVVCGNDDGQQAIDHALFRAESDYLCSADNYWHECKDDLSNIKKNDDGTPNFDDVAFYGSLIHANTKAYNCSEWDYSTNPTKPTKTEIVTWRELPGEDKDGDGVTDKLGDCQDDPTMDPAICLEREDPTECGVKYTSCASCIHPPLTSDETEVCGDGIDNVCMAGAKGKDVFNVNDDCDLKAYQNECKVKFASLPDPQSNNKLNLCCGDDGITDLGEKIKGKSGNYLCLKKDQALVSLGNGADIATIEADKWSDADWRWVRASGDAKFTIYTIKKPGEAVYDVASDGGDWQQCSVGSEGKMGSQFDKENGDKFYCYASGDQWSWAECCSKEGSCTSKDINGIKIRKAGQGTLDLMSLLNTEKNDIQFGQPGGFFSSEDTTLYETIYGQQYPSFGGYDYVDIYFDFSGETIEAGTALQMEVWSTTGKIASENVLANVVNGATLQTKKVYHAQIPVSGWRDITLITFKTTPTAVPVELKNIQVVKKDTNPICSGSNTWLNDIDEKDEAIEEGKMCQDLGLTWLGNDAVNRCCGDDQREYGVGSKGGCWNSQGIVSAQTVNDVKVELTYGKGEWMYDSTPVEVSTKVEIRISEFQLSLLTDIGGVKCEDKGNFKICYTDKANVKPTDLTVIGGNLFKHIGGFNPFDLPVDLSSNGYTCQLLETYTFCYDNSIDLKDKLFYLKNNQINIKSFTTSVTTTPPYSETITSAIPTKIDEITFTKTNFIEATLKDSTGGKVFFFNPLDDPTNMDEEKTTIKYEDLTQEKTVYYIMAKADTLKQTYNYNPSTTETLTYSCTTSMCTFPLKGSPPYTIKNVYPAKYNLYFVNIVDGKETRTFINPEKTIYATSGWLEVDNVPQQVVFNGTVFLGCGDTAALGTVPVVSQNMCFAQKTTTDGFYCAPDYGWKKDALPTMIYDNDNQLQLLSPEVLLKPEDRNHTSSIVFGRNILLNPMLDLTK